MNKIDKINIEKTARAILNMANNYYIIASGNIWIYREARQVCRDTLEAMKRNNLIKDYCISKNTLEM